MERVQLGCYIYYHECLTEHCRNELKYLALEVVKWMSLPGSITDVLIWLFKGWVVSKMIFLSLLEHSCKKIVSSVS